MVTGFAFGPWAFAPGQLQLLWLWHCLTCISAAHRGSPLRLNSPLDPSKPPTYPTCVSAPELQPTYPEILALWNAPLLVWSLGLSGDTHPPLSSIALCSQPLSLSQAPQAVSYPEPTGCFLHGSRLDPKETQVQEICSLPPAYRWVSVDSGKIQAKKVHWHWPALTRSAFSRFLVHSH